MKTAPASNSTVVHIVRIEIEGSGIENAELLPAAGGNAFAIFNVSADKASAWVDFDSRTVANSLRTFIIEAYDKPRGTGAARKALAMEERSWNIDNETVYSEYPGPYPLRRDTEPLEEMLAMSEQEYEEMMTFEWPRVHALLQEYIPNNVEFLPPEPNAFVGAKNSCTASTERGNGPACREYMSGITGLAKR